MSEPIVRVRQVMKTDFDTVDGMATVYDALKSMRHIETKCLIVNKRHDDDEVGVLLLSDVARKVIGQNRSPERVNVYEVMAKPVITVDPEMNIRYCARLFDRFELSRAPVVEHGKVVGIVSFTDMVLRGLLPE
ncbi:MAG: CBS domain-containing protein [Gammaproteobacteria bacterium]|jgi:CBS domain-containing protein|nr:CBS domain-containing protein [Gammaproteobacteria bacterium]